MKTNELMIGDWVQVPSELNRKKQIKSTFDLDSAVLYRPISINPEILEKNGFIKEPRYCHGTPLQYCVLVDGLWIDISGVNYFEGRLDYVHQLQHALRLCGIDKMIEL